MIQKRYIKSVIVSLIIILSTFTGIKQSFSQNYYYQKPLKANLSFGVSNEITGSGHSAVLVPSINYRLNKTIFKAGIAINYQNKSFSGINLKYTYILNDLKDDLQIFFQAEAMYRRNSPLNKRIRNLVYDKETTNNIDKFSTIEGYGGFGLSIPLIAGFSLNTSIGAGIYKRNISGSSEANYARFSQDKAVSLSLNAGINYSF